MYRKKAAGRILTAMLCLFALPVASGRVYAASQAGDEYSDSNSIAGSEEENETDSGETDQADDTEDTAGNGAGQTDDPQKDAGQADDAGQTDAGQTSDGGDDAVTDTNGAEEGFYRYDQDHPCIAGVFTDETMEVLSDEIRIELYGDLPADAAVSVFPVMIEEDGEETLAAYTFLIRLEDGSEWHTPEGHALTAVIDDPALRAVVESSRAMRAWHQDGGLKEDLEENGPGYQVLDDGRVLFISDKF